MIASATTRATGAKPVKPRCWTGYLALLLASLLITGCQNLSLIRSQQSDWRLKARAAITTPEESGAATLIWQKNQTESDFHLFGSLGGTWARLHESTKGASLELGDKRRFEGADAEKLLADVLGWPFPWRALPHWIKGQPAGLSGEQTVFDEAGQLSSVQWQQWTIHFERYSDFGESHPLPRIIDVRSQDFRLKIVVKSWTFGG